MTDLESSFALTATLVTAAIAAKSFYHVKPVAGYLLWPYVAFLLYANCLNYFHLKENGVSCLTSLQQDNLLCCLASPTATNFVSSLRSVSQLLAFTCGLLSMCPHAVTDIIVQSIVSLCAYGLEIQGQKLLLLFCRAPSL